MFWATSLVTWGSKSCVKLKNRKSADSICSSSWTVHYPSLNPVTSVRKLSLLLPLVDCWATAWFTKPWESFEDSWEQSCKYMFCHLIRTYQVVPISLVPVDTRLLFHLILCLVLSTFDYGKLFIVSLMHAEFVTITFVCLTSTLWVNPILIHINTYRWC